MGKSREELEQEAQQYADEYSNRNVDWKNRKDVGDYAGNLLKMVYGMTPLPEYFEWWNNPDYSTYDALYDLQDKYVPFNSAYQNWRLGKDQEWDRNAIDALTMAYPAFKLGKAGIGAAERSVARANAAYERATGKSAKGGFVDFTGVDPKNAKLNDFIERYNNSDYKLSPEEVNSLREMIGKVKAGKFTMRDSAKMTPNQRHVFTDYMQYVKNGGWEGELKPSNWSTLNDKERVDAIVNAYGADGSDREAILRTIIDAADKGKDPWESLTHAINGQTISMDGPFRAGDLFDAYQKAYPEEYARILSEYTGQSPKIISGQVKPKAADQAKLDAKAAKQAEKEARWKAEREAQARAAEEKRLAKEAEEKRLAEEEAARIQAEQEEAARLQAEADAKAAEEAAFEEEYQRMLAEEEAAKLAEEEAAKKAQEEFDYLYSQELAGENANHVASMDEFTDASTGIETPEVREVQNPTGTRASYDHSRPFNGGTFAVLDPIDRRTLRKNEFNIGDRIFDAHSKFLAGTTNPGEIVRYTSTGRRIREELPKNLGQDPYYQAGVINDANIRLNAKIDALRTEGLTDAQIYEELKPELEKYQGMVERYKYRLNNPESQFDYDGAITTNIVATPSEEINVLRALGLTPNDPRAANIMDKYNNFYGQLIDRINQYNARQKAK